MIETKEDILKLIHKDEWLMEILFQVKSLNLPDCWVCAGVIRSKIWDKLHGYSQRTPVEDVDVVYFDPEDLKEETEKMLEKRLLSILPSIPWSVKNQARMHTVNQNPPYDSTEDAISKFPETVTAIGVRMNELNELELLAPWGIENLLKMEVRPTEIFIINKDAYGTYEHRMNKKKWHETWPMIKVHQVEWK
ncbi:nucleotidyltransferase family protein [Peribacillus acanthi]|uniref:nucleotidyltransferase family protein n=1 Tax=Peribacillus acanthi TaxID=2171554 RepID=UPI001F0C9567|nr:nucleotidyltransferase family protein [Peribacillus acanthi]